MARPWIEHNPMRIAIVNDVWSAGVPTPEATLERFTTLTGWGTAIAAAGAEVKVFQRFHAAAQLTQDHVVYQFVADAEPPRPGVVYSGCDALHAEVMAWRPDVVHVNGLDYPLALRRLRRRAVGAGLAVQDHGGFDPRRLTALRTLWIRHGLAAADVLLVATPFQAELFRARHLVPSGTRVRDALEASTTFRAPQRGMEAGRFAVLWVGRLNANKDPLTALDGFARFLARRPDATLTFVYQDPTLESEVRARVAADPGLVRAVTMKGAIPHDEMPEVYAAADALVLGSHYEGSGYAVLEAMACGVLPVVTDIPSFRWLTDGGRIGALWTASDASSLCAALERTAAFPLETARAECLRRFVDCFSWPAIGRRAIAIYEELSRT